MKEPSQRTGAEEYLQAEIAAAGLESPGIEKEVRSALEALPGVEVLSIDAAHTKATVWYDPLLSTKADLTAAIAGHGIQTGEVRAKETSMYGHPEPP